MVVLTCDSEQSCVSLSWLNDDMPQTNYMNGLAYAFMEQWDKFGFRRRSGHTKPEWWLKKTIIFYPIFGSCLNFYKSFQMLFPLE